MNVSEVFHARYELLQRVGSGGFSEVWKALDMRSGMEVAIKVFRQQDSEGIALCREEYLKTFDFQHPNILTPFHFDVSDDRPYLVMKFLNGGTLADRLGGLNFGQTEDLIHQLGAALQYLHNRPNPVIHGDIKPDNILLDGSGNYFLTDFGISVKLKQKFTETLRASSIEESGKGVTPMAYRSPETFKYKNWEINETGPYSDIWSAGVTVYQVIYDVLPFNGEGGLGQLILMKSGNHPLEDIIEFDDGEFSAFNDVILSALQLYPDNRPNVFGQVPETRKSVTKAPEVATIPVHIPVVEKKPEPKKEKKKSNGFIYLLLAAFVVTIGFIAITLTKKADVENNSDIQASSQEIIEIDDDTLPRSSEQNLSPENINRSATANNISNEAGQDVVKVRDARLETTKQPVDGKQQPIRSEADIPAENNNVPQKKENTIVEKEEPAPVLPVTKTPTESKAVSKSKSVTIKPNIPIPLMLSEDISESDNLVPGSRIAFVVASDVQSYGDVFLYKGQKVQAVVKKVTKNKVKFHFPEIYTSGNTKLKSPNLDNFEITIGKDKKGTIFYPVTSSYQYEVNVK